LKATCELCKTGESSILGATSKAVGMGEKCYSKLLEKGAVWTLSLPTAPFGSERGFIPKETYVGSRIVILSLSDFGMVRTRSMAASLWGR
jgi:hypothetical protein